MKEFKNTVTCNNCSTNNPSFNLTCSNCKNYLRERIYNIDFWHTINLIVTSPAVAFRNIAFAEHKNFIVFLLVFIPLKNFINGLFISVYFTNRNSIPENLKLYFLLVFVVFVFSSFLFSFAIFKAKEYLKVQTRIKDNFTIIFYAFTPYLFALFLIFPVELIVFGGNLFSSNPSPFQLKETLAYTLLSFELLIIIWSFMLLVTGFFSQIKSRIFAFIFAMLFMAVQLLSQYFFLKVI